MKIKEILTEAPAVQRGARVAMAASSSQPDKLVYGHVVGADQDYLEIEWEDNSVSWELPHDVKYVDTPQNPRFSDDELGPSIGDVDAQMYGDENDIPDVNKFGTKAHRDATLQAYAADKARQAREKS